MKRCVALILATIFGTMISYAGHAHIRYSSFLPEELAMRFRCPEHYEEMEGDVQDVRDMAFQELLKRKLLRKGLNKSDVLFFLGDPYNTGKLLPPYDSLAEFEYGSIDGNYILYFKDNELNRIIETFDGEKAREETLLH